MKNLLFKLWQIWINLSIKNRVGIAFLIILLFLFVRGAYFDKGILPSESNVSWEPNISFKTTSGLSGKFFKILNKESRYYNSVRIEVNDRWKSSEFPLAGNSEYSISFSKLSDNDGIPMPQKVIINKGFIYLESNGKTKAISFDF